MAQSARSDKDANTYSPIADRAPAGHSFARGGFLEDFEAGIPADWAVFDNGIGLTESWVAVNDPDLTTFAYSPWENVDSGVAEDWLVTPELTLADSAPTLTYDAAQQFGTDFGSTYRILVSTTSQTDAASFTEVASYDESVFPDDGEGFSNFEVDLSAFAGQTVWIAFQHANDDGDSWLLDNVSVTTGAAGGDQASLPIDFEDENVDYELVDFGGNASQLIADPTDATNTVVESVRTETAECFAGTTVSNARGFAEPIPFAPGDTKMNVRVWSPQAGVRVLFKVEKFDDPTINVETFSFTTVAEQWETIEFDFANPMPNTNPINFGNEYSKASIFFDFQCNLPPTGTTPSTYYWDDVAFGPADMPGADVAINELRLDQGGSDLDEYFELVGEPGTDLTGLTYLVIGDGAAGDGVIENVTSLDGQSIPASGFFVAAEESFTLGTADFTTDLNFENGDGVTHLIVSGFTGMDGDDLDTDDDGTPDVAPWAEIVDAIGLADDEDGIAYGEALGFEDIGPNGSFPPAHAYRASDTDAWIIGQFDLGITDTPGEMNPAQPFANVQVIHNAPDPLASVVDVYLNGGDMPAIDDLAFRSGTGFIELPAGVNLEIGVAPGSSTGPGDIIASFPAVLPEGDFVVIAEGVLDPSLFEANPSEEDIAFDLNVVPVDVNLDALGGASVDLLIHHGITDAPAVDVVVVDGETVLADGIVFGDAVYLPGIPAADDVVIEVRADADDSVVFTVEADLIQFDGQLLSVLASGFLTPDNEPAAALAAAIVAVPQAGGSGVILPEPSEPGAIDFSPSPLVEMLSVGETGTETVTLTNNSDGDVAFDFSQYSGDAPPPSARVAPPYGEFAGESLNLAKGEDDPRAGEGQRFGEGGPDAFGYRWIDSNEPGGPSFDFVDISGTGTATGLDDDAVTTVALPFTFSFYGQDFDEIVISSNGFLSFDPDALSDLSNDPIPTAGGTENLIAALWDDLDPGNGDGAPGEIYYQDMGDGRFIVQYDMVPHWPDGDAELNTFEIILNQSGSILLQYSSFTDDASGPEGYTVGIENADGTDGLEIAFNEAYLEDGLAVLISTRPSFVTGVTPATGTIPAGGSADVDVAFSAEGLNGGTFESNLIVETDLASDPSTFELPVVLEVAGMAACALTAETITFEDTIIGNSSSEDATVMNGGTDSCELTDASADGPFSVEGFTAGALAPGESTTFSVVYTPTEAGDDTGTLTVNLANKDDLTAALEGSALDAPTPEVDTEALSFTVEEGDTDSGSFTLSNVGGANAADLEYSISVAEALLAARATQEAPVSGARPGAVLRSGESAHRIVPKTLPEGPFAQTSEAGSGEEIVQDGSFEAGTPNPSWTEFSATFGTPLCDAACGLGGGTGPFDGNWWTWFGGTAAGDEGSVEQDVEIPSGSAMLSFYLEIPVAVDAPGSMTVLMDGDELFAVTEADQATYATYQQVMIDVSDYADGGTHTLRFESTTSANGNFFVDLVSIVSTGPALVSVAPESGSIAPGESEEIAVTVNAAEVDPGTYEFNLAIATNDPSNPTLTIPVTVVVEPIVSNEQDGVPTEFALGQNYPNPFASRTTIDYALPEAARVTITVYDAVGRQVAVLVDKDLTTGFHTAEWDTRGLASGVYLYRIQAGDYTKTRKMSIVR